MPPLPPPITSRTNARVKALRAAFSGKAGRPGELAGIEGWKTISEALGAGLLFDTLAVSEDTGLSQEQIAAVQPRELLILSRQVMASVADLQSAPEIVATVAIPHDNRQGPQSRVYLLLEDIQDPGNLGTLIRSADAFGVEQVTLSPGCANPWSPKVIRASAGSVFRVPVVKRPFEFVFPAMRKQGIRLLGAVVAGGDAKISFTCDFSPPLALVIGNEGSGLSGSALSVVDDKVYIPSSTESLNAAVAGSILLYAASSRFGQQVTRDGEDITPGRVLHGAV